MEKVLHQKTKKSENYFPLFYNILKIKPLLSVEFG